MGKLAVCRTASPTHCVQTRVRRSVHQRARARAHVDDDPTGGGGAAAPGDAALQPVLAGGGRHPDGVPARRLSPGWRLEHAALLPGRCRLEAAQQLGWANVDTLLRLDGFTEPWERALLRGRDVDLSKSVAEALEAQGTQPEGEQAQLVLVFVRKELKADGWKVGGALSQMHMLRLHR